MKWKAKYTKVDYPNLATRVKRVFAWKPTYIAGLIVWLQYYEVLQVYEIKEFIVEIDGEKVYFSKSDWIDLSKRLEND